MPNTSDKHLVFFDIDGTLVHGRSVERRFVHYLWAQRDLGLRQLACLLTATPKAIWRYGQAGMRRNKHYLNGLPQTRIQQTASDWVAKELEPWWVSSALARLRWHKDRGHRVVLLTGTVDFLAEAIARQLQISDSISSAVEVKNGVLLGGVVSSHPFGQEKQRLARQYIVVSKACPDRTWAYANSIHDVPLLSWVSYPVAVRPDFRLRQIATRERWPQLV